MRIIENLLAILLILLIVSLFVPVLEPYRVGIGPVALLLLIIILLVWVF